MVEAVEDSTDALDQLGGWQQTSRFDDAPPVVDTCMQALALDRSPRLASTTALIGSRSVFDPLPRRRGLAMHLRPPALLVCLAYAVIGFTPIVALALTVGGLWPLGVGALVLIVPAIIGAVALGVAFPKQGHHAVHGLLAGLAAVLVYDIVRWTFVGLGWWGDFIPNIGGWLTGTGEPNWILGYGFRWLGDGGGIGLTFAVAARTLLPGVSRRTWVAAGIAYGLAIWVCLLITLIVSPEGQSLLFPITPVTLLLSWIGHVVYGGVLGAALAWAERAPDTPWSREEPRRLQSRRNAIGSLCSYGLRLAAKVASEKLTTASRVWPPGAGAGCGLTRRPKSTDMRSGTAAGPRGAPSRPGREV